jgi:Ricin-type beta-trefoil lectin domain
LQIRNVDFGNKSCLEVQKDKKGSPATMYKCHGDAGNQYWEYYKGILRRDSHYLTSELDQINF